MSVKHFTTGNFDEALGPGVTLVDFWAAWCGPCKMIAPLIEQLADEYQGRATIGKLDVDAEGPLAAQYGVMSIPTLIYFKDGVEQKRLVGVRPKQELTEAMESLL